MKLCYILVILGATVFTAGSQNPPDTFYFHRITLGGTTAGSILLLISPNGQGGGRARIYVGGYSHGVGRAVDYDETTNGLVFRWAPGAREDFIQDIHRLFIPGFSPDASALTWARRHGADYCLGEDGGDPIYANPRRLRPEFLCTMHNSLP